MKKIELLFIYILVTTGLQAQYTTFPKGKANWRTDENRGILRSSAYPNASASSDTRYYYQTGDTSIGNTIYKKIFEKALTTYPNDDSTYYGALREDVPAKKVYFKGIDWKEELLLFNFDLKIGDTIQGWYSLDSLPDSSYFIVRNIKKLKYNTFSLIERNVYEMEAFKLPKWAYTFPSICLLYEGIGFASGLFKSPIRNNKYKRQFRQSCFYDGIVEIKNCESVTAIADKNSSQTGFALYPNPTSVTLGIQTSLQIARLVVYQSNGIKALESKATENLDVSALPEGLYLLEVWDLEGRRVLKKFEKR